MNNIEIIIALAFDDAMSERMSVGTNVRTPCELAAYELVSHMWHIDFISLNSGPFCS